MIMLDQSAYKYYLRNVLGVESYIGSPMQGADQSDQLQSTQNQIAAMLGAKPVVVVDPNLNPSEIELLNKIMTAVNHADYKIIDSSLFNEHSLTSTHCVVFNSNFYKDKNNFEVFELGAVKLLKAPALKHFLPPNPPTVIANHKKQLWISIKNLFKAAR